MIPHERAPVKHGKRKRRAAMALTDRCAALKCGGACPLFLHFFAGQPFPCVAGASERKMLFAFFLKGPTDMVARRARFGYTGLTPFYETNMGEGSMPVIMKLLSRRGALRALENARAALGDATPLKRDCGRLCGAACCQPDETGLNGMLLFPFEETYYRRPIEGFPFRLVDDDTLFKGGKRLVCEGTCPPRTPAPGLPHLSAAHPRAGRRAGRSCALHGGAGPARMVRMPAAGAGRAARDGSGVHRRRCQGRRCAHPERIHAGGAL